MSLNCLQILSNTNYIVVSLSKDNQYAEYEQPGMPVFMW